MQAHWKKTALAVCALAIAACGNDDEPAGDSEVGGADVVDDAGADVPTDYVFPDDCAQSIMPSGEADDQAALRVALISDAVAGDVVCLGPGEFSFFSELAVATSGVTLRGAGMDDTILDFSMQDVGANGVLITGDSVTMRDLTVRNSPGDGVRANEVRNVAFIDMKVWWDADESLDNGAYGLYPVGCEGVLIDGVVVKGARDAGIYVGQSNHILVTDSEAFGNVAGIEIENSVDAEVRNCHAHDNTAGILVFNLPGLPVYGGERTVVHNNVVENNNVDNFAEDGTIVGTVPPGIGMLVLASDFNEFRDNTVTGNDTAGIIIVTYLNGLYGVHDDENFDPFSEGNWVHDNTFTDNGLAPRGVLNAVVPLPEPRRTRR